MADDDMLPRLIRLCHPDKHGNSDAANEATAWLLAVECKAPKGRLRPEQAEFLSLVQKFGGCAFVAHNCLDVARELVPTG